MKNKGILRENSGVVYHYTSLDTFLKLLDGIKNGYFQFHGSDILSMNDPTEFIHGFIELWRILPKIEDDYYDKVRNNPNHFQIDVKTLDDKFRLSKMWDDKNNGISCEKMISDYVNAMHESILLPFVVSFSCQKDFLPMWSTYGDGGHGIALGIDIQAYYIKKRSVFGKTLFDISNYNENELHSVLVSYDNISVSHPLALYVQSFLYTYLKNVQEAIDDEAKIARLEEGTIRNIFIFSSALIKNKVYSYEEESRLLCNCSDVKDVHFKINANQNVVPYIHVNIPVSKLKDIILGPCCDEESTRLMLTTRLNQLGIVFQQNRIQKSCIPYR